MNFLSFAVLSVWILGCVSAAFAALMLYRGYLAQHETEQLYLAHEAPSVRHRHVDTAARRVSSVGRICRYAGVANLISALAAVGIWSGHLAAAGKII